ncbi:hypothetical protein JZ751_006610, partial [Albula glossodonta]
MVNVTTFKRVKLEEPESEAEQTVSKDAPITGQDRCSMGNVGSSTQSAHFQGKEDRVRLQDSLMERDSPVEAPRKARVRGRKRRGPGGAGRAHRMVHPATAEAKGGFCNPVYCGKAVTISCSVSHTCPSEPPQITWSHNGTLNIQSEQLQPPNGQWKVTSVLTFTPTIADHNKKVTCTAEYPLRSISKSAQASQLLSVKYAPVSVRAETETPVVKEGDSVQLVCSSDSNPRLTATS